MAAHAQKGRGLRRQGAGGAEVRQLHVARLGHHHVLGLEVPEDEARLVHGAQRRHHLAHDEARGGLVERALGHEVRVQVPLRRVL